MTQADVADAMAKASASGATVVSQGYVSRAEAGRLTVTDDRLAMYATALGYPRGLLCLAPEADGAGVGLIHHRKRASLSVATLRHVRAQLALTHIQLRGLTSAAGNPASGHRFTRVALDDLVTAEDAAGRVRRSWGIPPGPVPDMIGAIEEAGGLVVVRDLGGGLLDAAGQWGPHGAPLLLVSNRAPGLRRRFGLAHELGHLVMHTDPGSGPEQEKQADAFAAEFLMPASDIRKDFTDRVDLPKLMELQRTWRVSMTALLRRALDLGAVTEWRHRTVTAEMSALGYRTAEPAEIARERPGLVSELVRALLDEHGLPLAEAASRAYLLPEDFQRLYVESDRTSSL
ncbi:ImmA/IrrE family metallo-endopeptidase [Streptomyces sp. NPDC006798]|uniref:ImmA/IrrE family metallo-endopeptidase n=1 Tax=Streptomyces sp. NPDC006798 TaxID=3155462 RepID=UPI0033E82839